MRDALSLSVGSCARVFVAECDPFCALQACFEGVRVVAIETVVSEIDIFVSSMGNFNTVTLGHMKKLKNNAFVGNTGHIDNETDLAGSEGLGGMEVVNIKPQKVFSSSPLDTG